MPRIKTYPRLLVYQNGDLVGFLSKQPSGAVEFIYAHEWLSNDQAYPVSLSLPLREDAYKGAPVVAVFENLLPDSTDLRSLVAEKVGADGTDAYSLLARIGRDCVGALQFVLEGEINFTDFSISGEAVTDEEIENILNNLSRAPLGLNRKQDFRISIAGAQEKTALLFHEGKWKRPFGSTPTTHILKTQIGKLPNDIDLSNSVENEFYSLKMMQAFGLPVNNAEMMTFGNTKSLVIERFDRGWTKSGALLRIPQEDLCQALSVPPTRKYQSDGGIGNVEILKLLKASDNPAEDQKKFIKAQIVFWLMGATDGHAKNFSIFLGAGGRFILTPFYDVLTAQPFFYMHQISQKDMKMAMSVGESNHYRMEEIQGRHFVQTVKQAGVPDYIAEEAIEEILESAENVYLKVEEALPHGFPEEIHESVSNAVKSRLKFISISTLE